MKKTCLHRGETDLKTWVSDEHRRAELERLRAGYDGCGCTDCQELYATLDLKKYGNRVLSGGGITTITAGRAGADLWEPYNTRDYWTPEGVFIFGGKKDANDESLRIICLRDVVEPSLYGSESSYSKQNVVSKIPDKGIIPTDNIQAGKTGIMKQRGRPRKTGVISRVTAWRREKELEVQGVLM